MAKGSLNGYLVRLQNRALSHRGGTFPWRSTRQWALQPSFYRGPVPYVPGYPLRRFPYSIIIIGISCFYLKKGIVAFSGVEVECNF